jgi:hypothetical protein
MTSDPIRLLDDPQAAAALRGDLTHASAATVQGLDHAAGIAGLKVVIAAETAAAGTAAAGAGSLAKIAIVVALVGGGAVAVWAATRGDGATAPEPVQAASTAKSRAEADAPRAEPAPVPEVVRTDVQRTAELEPPTQLPVAAPEPEEEEPLPEPEPEPAAASHRHRTAGKGHKAAHPDVAAADRVLREARMIADARAALGSSPSKALALAQEAAREFPRGQLVEEREAIAIRALAGLGRTQAANTRAERFLARYGSGPHAEAVRRAIASTAQ